VISPRNVLGSSSILPLLASNSEEAMRRKREGGVDLTRRKRGVSGVITKKVPQKAGLCNFKPLVQNEITA